MAGWVRDDAPRRMTSDLTSAPVPPLRADDHVRGPDGAPLLIVYADFTCPRCALMVARVSGARLRVCFRHFALNSRHVRAVPTAVAAEAAARQGAFWALHDALYADQGRIDDPHIWASCEELGFDGGTLMPTTSSANYLSNLNNAFITTNGAITESAYLPNNSQPYDITTGPDGALHQGAPEGALVAAIAATPPRS